MDELENVRITTSVFEFHLCHLRRWLRRTEENIEPDSSCVQCLIYVNRGIGPNNGESTHRFLRHKGKMFPVFLDIEVGYRLAVDSDLSRQGIIESLSELNTKQCQPMRRHVIRRTVTHTLCFFHNRWHRQEQHTFQDSQRS